MKNKLVLVSVFVFLGLIAVGAKVIVGQTVSTLPRVTTACESRIGGLIMGIDDGFSSLKSCPGNSRRVILGQEQTATDGGSTVTIPGVLFIDTVGMAVMLKDGTVKEYIGGQWVKNESRSILPTGVTVENIANWSVNLFVTKSGEIYSTQWNSDYTATTWVNIGNPMVTPTVIPNP